MFFAFLVFFASFLIEGIGTYVSVVGLSSLFAANPVIITLAVALDIGKIVTVSFLYKHWSKINLVMKAYMLTAATILMMITSAGAFGYLSAEFQKAISDTNQGAVILSALEDERDRLSARKQEIDSQVANLPDSSVRGRTALMKSFAPEVSKINDRLIDIDAEIPKLKIENIKKNVEVGPIIFIAEAFGTTPEQAVKWVILIIILVFDPLAIVLLLAGNYLIALPKQKKPEERIIDIASLPETNEPVIPNPHFIRPAPAIIPSLAETYHDDGEVAEDEAREKSEKTGFGVFAALSEKLTATKPDLPADQVDFQPTDIQETEEEANTQQVIKADETENIELPLEEPIAEEPIVEQPAVEEKVTEEREVIRLEDIMPKAVHKSSLEDIDGRRGDVETAEGLSVIPSSLRKIYGS